MTPVLLIAAALAMAPPAPTLWRIDALAREAPPQTVVLGHPRLAAEAGRPCVIFDGREDGLFIGSNPLSGWPVFTVQALFKPDPEGPPEQRFLHIEDRSRRRLTLETRLDGRGGWALDAFLRSEHGRRPLLDRRLVHPAGLWHWVALRYDGRTMATFVDGKPELQAPLRFPPMEEGRTGIGVRLDRVYWYKGAIALLRFDPRPVPESELQRGGGAPAAFSGQ